MMTGLIFFLALISTASLTASLLLWFVLAPSALANLIAARTKRVVVPGEVFNALAGQEDFQLSADDLESPEPPKANGKARYATPTFDEMDV